jgi:outer membrane protein assembly factor BamA/autotransporter translocation and assembly factor TamB
LKLFSDRPRRRLVRRAALVSGAAGLCVASLLLAAHTSWVQGRVARWAAAQLLPHDIVLTMGAVRYNLATFSVHVENLVASTTTDRQHPFLQAARLDATVPRSIIAGRLALSSLTGDGVSVMLVRRPDGSTNFPRNDGAGPSSLPSPFPIGTLDVSNVSVAWRDEILDMSADAGLLSINLRPASGGASGTMTLGRPATLRAGDHQTTVAADAQLAWNGSQLTFDALRLEAPEATLSAAGSIGLLAAGRPIVIDATGSANLDRLTAWFALGPRPRGRVAFRAHATGSVADPIADVTLTSQNVGWQGLTNVSAEASVHIGGDAVDIGPVTVRALGGSATGRGRVALSAGEASAARARATVDWRDLDLAALLAALDQQAPVRVGTRIDGHADATWTTWTTEGLTAAVEATTRSAARDNALGLSGTLTLSAGAGQWRGAIDQWLDRAVRLEGRADGRLAPASLAAPTIAGTLVATADSWPEVWGTLRRLGLVSATPPATLGGRARADLTLSGRVGDPGLAGHLDASLADLDDLPVDAPPNLRLSGPLSLSATISGTFSDPAIDGTLGGERLSIAGQHAERLDASIAVTTHAAGVESLVLTQGDGRLTGSGRYDLRTNEMDARLSASNVMVNPITGAQPGEILVPLTARLSGEWRASGTPANPQGSGHVDLTDTQAWGRSLGRVSSQLTLTDHRLQASVSLPDLVTAGTATLALTASGAFIVDTQTTDADLAALAERLGVAIGAPVTGLASFAAHIDGVGDDLAHARGTVDLQRLDGAIGDVPVHATQPGRASYDGRTVDVAGLTLTVGGSRLHVSGQLGPERPGTLAASLDGDAADLQQLTQAFLPDGRSGLQIAGQAHIDIRASGTLDRPALTAEASLDDGRVAVVDQEQATALIARAAYDAGVFTLSRLDATWQGASVSATGEIPIALLAPDAPEWLTGGSRAPSPGTLRARVDGMTPAVLAPFVPAETVSQLSGLVSGALTLDADRPSLDAVRGHLVLDRADLVVSGIPFGQQQPTRVDVANGRAQITHWVWGAGDNRLSLSGGARFEGDRALDISLDGAMDLRTLGAFLPGVTSGGRATLTGRVTGAPAAPQLEGRIDLQGGEWRNASPRVAVSNLTGSVLLTRDELTISGVEGQINGGELWVAGRLKHSGLQLTSGSLAITGHGLALAIPDALKTQVNLDLVFGVDRGSLTLSGDAMVLGGGYREPISLASGLLQFLGTAPAALQLDTPSASETMALDIRLTTSEDIIVDNNYGQLALAADVRIGGTVAAPTLVGRAEAREGGRIFLGGNVYQIVGTGVIDFANPARIEPDLRITAHTRVSGYTISLNLNGPPATLETTLTSEPSLSQSEIVSLLVTGQKEHAGALAISGDQIMGYLSGEVLGVTGRVLGLDTLRVQRSQDVRFDAGLVASETDPTSRLTFGKQVTPTVDIVFSQSLKESGKLTWIIAYRPKPNLELRLVSQDNEARIYGFRHDVTIGGASASAPSPARPTSIVASVTFTGESGVPEADLRGRLRLHAGDTFDFYKWQQDRDRLERSLGGDDYLEAQVTARRSGSPSEAAATVDLTYDVYRGPRTVIDISGLSRDGPVRKELARIWDQAVVDAFLLDEARNAARAALIRDRYVRATVTATIERRHSPDEKHLVVSIEPGTQYEDLRLAFTGQQHVSAERLDELARLSPSPWIDPAPLTKALTTMYRNEGFLDADVRVGSPVFDAASATLPIVVREGPLFRLESVAFVGTHARTPAAAARAFGLQPGAALTRDAADAAVLALTASYRTEGFNAVRVTLTNEATRPTGLVALTVTVDEGPRQVVRDVVVTGVRRTSPTLVSRALKIDAGQPVDLSAWAQSRKRLYDSSVFRQVDVRAEAIEGAPVSGAPPQAEQPIRARVTLEEWPPLRVRYGFDLDDELRPASEATTLRPGVAADATYRNVFGRAASTGLAARYTKNFRATRGFFSTPFFFGLPLTSNLFVARSREQLGTSTDYPYIKDTFEFTAEQRFRAWRRLQVAYSYGYQRNHTFDVNVAPDDPLAYPPINVARLTTTAFFDTRDDLVDATRGLLFSSTFEYGAGPLGSDLRFAKWFIQQNYYRTLGRSVVFATSGRLGLGAGFGQELIGWERFYAGGGNSVRGFGQDALGPVDYFGDPAGGNALLVFNEELRFPIAWRFRGVGFLDAGNTFATIRDFGLTTMRAGTGVGLRVETPFALLRIDLATPLWVRPGETRLRWFFSIGQSF